MQNEDLSYTKRNQCHLRQASAVAIVEQETPPGTEGVLTEVALGTPGRFPAFDNLVTLTVRAADGDERHGPFLPMRSYEDKAQCDIHLSPSPLLKHYRKNESILHGGKDFPLPLTGEVSHAVALARSRYAL